MVSFSRDSTFEAFITRHFGMLPICRGFSAIVGEKLIRRSFAVFLRRFEVILYSSVSWLNDVQNKVERLPAQIQEQPQLFAVTSRVHCFTTCISERDDIGSTQMEIDQNTQVSFIESQSPEKVVQRVDEYFKNEIISELINELVSSNLDDETFLNQIEKIKSTLLYTNTSSYLILEKYSKTLAEYGVGHIKSNPAIIEAIATLYQVSVPEFLRHNIGFINSYIVIDCEEKSDTFERVAAILDIKVRVLCIHNIYPVLLRILLEEDSHKLRNALEFLRNKLFGQTVKELVQEKETMLIIDLAMYLGRDDMNEQILHAFERLTEMVNKRATSLSDILSNSLFGITMAVSTFISQKRNHTMIIKHPNAIKALKAVINEIGPEINRHTMHLMKLFDTIYDVEGMQLEALDLWTVLIHALSPSDILSHLNAFLRRLIQFVHIVDKSTRKKVAKEIEYILIDGNLVITPGRYLSLPVIPDFEELENTRQYIASKTEGQMSKSITNILKCLSDPDDAEVQSALHRLDNFLKVKENNVEDIISNVKIASQLYSRLLSIARKYAHHKDIPYLAAVCLGKLGATDPSILPVSVNDDNIIILSNFKKKEENVSFVAGLIENYLIPAFNTSTDEQTHQFIQYTIQTLLVCAKFSPIKQGTSIPLDMVSYGRWRKFPVSVQEFLLPLLSSSYDCAWQELDDDYPIYNNMVTFSDWIEKWYSKLTKQAYGDAKDIFKACIPVIRSGNLDVAHYLIPCLVLHIVHLDDSEYSSHILKEMITVLNAVTEDKEKKNLSCLKVVVSITHYFRVWMRFRGIGTSDARTQVSIVNEFLSKIPDKLMAYASMSALAYPQALMHYEKYLKEDGEKINSDEAINMLRQIYGHLNDKDSMQVLIDGYSKAFSVEHEWLQYENEERWDIAEISLKEQVRKYPNKLTSYTNYLDCLQKAGEYEQVIHTSILPKDKIHWNPQINSYKISAAWKTENWTQLDQLVNSPLERKFEALLGSVICNMRCCKLTRGSNDTD
ncbi:hypothetical protein K501DRAFT_328274 [Backusella circina FSU 941]|nr:hypothetical protein K501DRAFT_328274 [Backusella circina FSU 941]